MCMCGQGKPFCRCWVHNAFVNVDGEKMSKSKGNFLTLKGTLDSALDVRAFRYLVVASQYRTTLAFSKKSLDGARNTVQRLDKLRVSCTSPRLLARAPGKSRPVPWLLCIRLDRSMRALLSHDFAYLSISVYAPHNSIGRPCFRGDIHCNWSVAIYGHELRFAQNLLMARFPGMGR